MIFPRGFIQRFHITPGTLNNGTLYFAATNALATGQIYIAAIQGNASFSGTTASSRSAFSFFRKPGAISGGSAITSNPLNSGAPTTDLVVTESDTGITGPSPGSRMHIVSVPSVNGCVVPIRMRFFDDNPCILEAGESLIIAAHGPVIAGSGLSGSILLYGGFP